MMGDRRLSPSFWAKVQESAAGCWLWTAATTNGYGRFTIGKVRYLSHRLTYETLISAVPDDLQLDHLCRNRLCCNPAHLEPVTRQENVRRGLRGELRTHCKWGHPLAGDNLINRSGRRICRTCRETYFYRRIGFDEKKATLALSIEQAS